MWFIVHARDTPGTLAQRIEARPAHRARLTALRDEGRLLVAGPIPAIESEDPGPAGFLGSLVIAEFASLADAKAWAQADPYVANGVYAQVDVMPYIRALP